MSNRAIGLLSESYAVHMPGLFSMRNVGYPEDGKSDPEGAASAKTAHAAFVYWHFAYIHAKRAFPWQYLSPRCLEGRQRRRYGL
jgi:hypothetical protein